MVILQEQVIEVCDNYRENGEIKYLWLNSVDLAIERVGKRVATGGHSIPEDTIRRRYRTGIQNLSKFYMPICDY